MKYDVKVLSPQSGRSYNINVEAENPGDAASKALEIAAKDYPQFTPWQIQWVRSWN